EAAARRAFDRALSNLWKLQGPRLRDDATRAAQSEAYVKAPMPEQRRESNGAAASDNSNPICDTEPAAYDQEPSPITRKATPV
ncbi:MAG TPA: hypothetical protein VN428_23080, partial [Bryobacteraceae bacterium]|nr:hypothetical protein [Bryobacteraceae bacterium]